MTGENWQEIMLSCYDSAECDARASPMPNSRKCGSTNWAIPYFCTFIFLCMFFVSIACFLYQQFKNGKEIMAAKQSLYVIKIHVDLHKTFDLIFSA